MKSNSSLEDTKEFQILENEYQDIINELIRTVFQQEINKFNTQIQSELKEKFEKNFQSIEKFSTDVRKIMPKNDEVIAKIDNAILRLKGDFENIIHNLDNNKSEFANIIEEKISTINIKLEEIYNRTTELPELERIIENFFIYYSKVNRALITKLIDQKISNSQIELEKFIDNNDKLLNDLKNGIIDVNESSKKIYQKIESLDRINFNQLLSEVKKIHGDQQYVKEKLNIHFRWLIILMTLMLIGISVGFFLMPFLNSKPFP